ncbi:MAG: TIGR03086 family metal-binding protein [Actinomadura sp.]
MNDDLHRYLAESATEAARVARGITSERLSARTPCSEFDTRTLLNHWVLYTGHGLEHRARREPLSEELQDRDFTADPAWADGYAAQLDRAVAAWADPVAWEGEIDLGGMAMPAPEVAALILKEMVVHGWDVAKATGQEFHCSEEVAKVILRVVEEHAEIYRRYQGFAEPVDVPGGASAFDRALALSGRDPHWSPATT